MADIFLSYAREDLAKARQLAAALEKQGWSVFWDRTSLLAGQDFDEVIEQEIKQAGCMIVAWSVASKRSDWVRGEANVGRERKILVPILFDSVEPPIAFRSLHTENLATWNGEINSSEYLALCKAVTKRIGPGIPSASRSYNPPSKNDTKTKIRWPKQFTVKVGKITVIMVTLAILVWVARGFFSQQDKPIPSEAPSANPKVTDQTQSKEPEMVKIPDSSNQLNSNAGDNNEKLVSPVQTLIKEPEMVKIPAGSIQMGSNDGDNNEKPVHPVRLKSFAIGRYEVTFDEYDQFAEAVGELKPDDNGWGRGRRPVIDVSWEQAKAYSAWLSEKTGKRYRLPTEAEWEYAARANTTTDYYWNGQGEAKDYAWFTKNSENITHPVGKKKPNTFGLYDMSGNVWEWVDDCWHVNYNNAPADGSAWQEHNDGDCLLRVMRGGSWDLKHGSLRSAYRTWYSPVHHYYSIGFRLARD